MAGLYIHHNLGWSRASGTDSSLVSVVRPPYLAKVLQLANHPETHTLPSVGDLSLRQEFAVRSPYLKVLGMSLVSS